MRWRSAGLKANLCQAQQRDLKTIAPLSHRPIVLADSIDYRTIGFLHYRPNPNLCIVRHVCVARHHSPTETLGCGPRSIYTAEFLLRNKDPRGAPRGGG